MTEKQFKNVEEELDWGTVQYFTYNGKKINDNDLENLVNHLLNENEQLKQELHKIKVVNEMLSMDFANSEHELWKENEELKQFKEKVFVLLNEKIKHYEHKPLSAPVGEPMSVNFDVDVDRLARLSELQELKRELEK